LRKEAPPAPQTPEQRRPPPTASSPPVLATKLEIPTLRRELVTRPALLQLLEDSTSRKLTLLSAPPGWGKTTLLSEWASKSQGARFAWLSLENDDSDPSRFWMYVIEALRTAAPSLGTRSLPLLGAPGVNLTDMVLPELVNEIDALASDLVLVLDDYHLITNAQVSAGLTFLVDHLPPSLQIAIASRSDPPLPLPRLRARRELLELRLPELRFNEQETSVLLNDILGLELAPRDVARLYQRTEGWIAALCLAALSLRSRRDRVAFIEAFSGDDRHLVDFLAAEVLEQEPAEVRTFLLQTSILRRLNGELCDAVINGTGSAEMLEEIERSNLFLVPLDAKRKWYRYHHLFGDLLRHELNRSTPQLVPELDRRAAKWHRERGSIEEAIFHAVAAGDVSESADMLAAHWNQAFNQGRLATVARWLDALPKDTVAHDPRLCTARAWVAMDLARLDEADVWIEMAERALTDQPVVEDGEPLDARIALLRTVQRFKAGNVTEAAQAVRRAVALEAELTPFSLTVAYSLLGITLYWSGRRNGARQALRQALALAEQSGNALAGIYGRGYLALIEVERGELEQADRSAELAMTAAGMPAAAEHFVTMMAQLARGAVLAERRELAEAVGPLERALELARRGAGKIEVAHVSVALARVRHALGESSAAGDLVKDARRAVEGCPDIGIMAEKLAEIERSLTTSRHAVSPSQELSDRELAVLKLLPTRLSQREIGDALYVSLNTVKSHVRSIFRKLNAASRKEAVDRARETRLL
jgi:LuxR family maltose regulon positive regulatory protein